MTDTSWGKQLMESTGNCLRFNGTESSLFVKSVPFRPVLTDRSYVFSWEIFLPFPRE